MKEMSVHLKDELPRSESLNPVAIDLGLVDRTPST